MNFILMKCGCVAHGLTPENKPICAVHMCLEPSQEMPSLDGRKAKCSYGHKVVNSSYDLPFFVYCPNKEHDEYYCGCFGWN